MGPPLHSLLVVVVYHDRRLHLLDILRSESVHDLIVAGHEGPYFFRNIVRMLLQLWILLVVIELLGQPVRPFLSLLPWHSHRNHLDIGSPRPAGLIRLTIYEHPSKLKIRYLDFGGD